ncbi:MAG: hypothetical protein NUV61_02400 [Candidatus Azambacteria bacterium]|nr:hypothetical protein [Candidatus Azambacteria bacterium]
MSAITVLGVGGFLHDGSISVIQGDEITTAIELERLNRSKHSGWKTPEEILHAIQALHIDMNAVTHIAWADEFLFYHSPKTRKLAEWVRKAFPNKIQIGIDHHMCHLASSFYASTFEQAALVSIDGKGDMKSVAIGHGQGNKISLISKVNSCYSLGRLWNATNSIMGMPGYQNSGKTMALAAFGTPKYLGFFLDFTKFLENGMFMFKDRGYEDAHDFDQMLFNSKQLIIRYICDKIGIEPRDQNGSISQKHFDFVASLQAFTNMLVKHIIKAALELTGLKKVCMAGGVALNGLANMSVLENLEMEDIFIQPATGDTGLSLGASYYMYHHILEQPRQFSIFSPYLGKSFSDEEIELVIKSYGLSFSKEENVCHAAARLIADEKIIGWFQGRDEMGPRSLGNRSILCTPEKAYMKNNINQNVKHREWFRPFAPAVLEEHAQEYFEINRSSRYMLFMPKIRPEKICVIPAVAHTDNTARVQTVLEDLNPKFYRLIKEFHKITGIPILLNTSFNDGGQPIVHSPGDAIECFLNTGIDCLIIGDYLIAKRK